MLKSWKPRAAQVPARRTPMLREKRLEYLRSLKTFARFVYQNENHLAELLNRHPRGEEISNSYSSAVFVTHQRQLPTQRPGLPLTMQLSAGPLGSLRYTESGKHAFEEGLSLVYSIGPTGDVAVILYPFQSEVSSAFEDSILLGIIPPDQAKLQKRLSRDVKDFIAYGYVTALDAKPTFMEFARVAYLRFMKPTHKEKKYTPSESSGLFSKLKTASLSGIASGLLRFITLAAAVYLGARYGIQTK